jgi:hypothetical protein
MRGDCGYAKKEAQNCWEYWDCHKDTKTKCPAFKIDAGTLCVYTTLNYRPIAKRDFDSCFDCPWYKKITPA